MAPLRPVHPPGDPRPVRQDRRVGEDRLRDLARRASRSVHVHTAARFDTGPQERPHQSWARGGSSMSESTVAIVGSGIVGSLIAYLLTDLGYDVHVFEKGPDYPYPHRPQFDERVH